MIAAYFAALTDLLTRTPLMEAEGLGFGFCFCLSMLMPGQWEIRPGLKLRVKAAQRRVLRGLALTRSCPGRYSLSRDGIRGIFSQERFDL